MKTTVAVLEPDSPDRRRILRAIRAVLEHARSISARKALGMPEENGEQS